MTNEVFCDLLPNTGSSTGISGLILAIALTIAGAGLVFMARRGGMRTAAMAILPVAFLVPAGTQQDAPRDDKGTQIQDCVERPQDYIHFDAVRRDG